MNRKKEESSPDYRKYLAKIVGSSNIENLSKAAKSLLKEMLDIKYELTFKEIGEITAEKHLPAERKSKIIFICEKLETISYKPKLPTKEELREIKTLFEEIITSMKFTEEKHKSLFKSIAEKILQDNQKHAKIKKKVEKAKQEIGRDVIEKIKKKHLEKKLDSEKYREQREISRFVNISLNAGIKRSQIMQELYEIGFRKEDVETLLKKCGSNKINKPAVFV